MDRASLERMLEQGLSLAEIGRRLQRHESTVAYWVQKYGLSAARRDLHAARGELHRDDLEPLVRSGASIADIASEVGRSKTAVRHWLSKYGLRTTSRAGRRPSPEAKAASDAGVRSLRMGCARHGETDFYLDARGGYRCRRCR